ncbi:MAG: glycosyltransferase family 39 protein [Planctomycetes bacterium]|jgi:hypothetical protein|nr:glycosyltransferase family 39 protein [Planctomycetota bacterium]
MIAQYAAVFLIALALFGVSCAPGAVWQDSGLIQYRVWHEDLEGSLGLALAHPLYYAVAIGVKHVPLGPFGWRINFVSAVAAAVAVANLFLLVRLWLGRDFPAVVAAMSLAVAHTFWWHASLAETYTLWAALLLAELIVLLQYTRTKRVGYLYGLGLLNGLALAIHMLAVISLACYLVFFAVLLARKELRARDLGLVAALWILGASPYEYLIVKNVIESGDLLGTLASATVSDRWQADVLNTTLSWRLIKEDALLVLLNFPTPNALLLPVGLYGLYRARGPAAFRNLVLALLALFFVFACRYTIADRYAFFLPFYCIVALVIGFGVHVLQTQVRRPALPAVIVVLAVVPVGIYAVAPALAQRLHLRLGTRQDIPYRNDYVYFLQPWRTGYHGAERFAREALTSLESDAVLCADATTVAPLLYAQEVQGLRPDVHIVAGIARSPAAPCVNESTVADLVRQRPVYVVSRQPGYCPAFLLDRYPLAPAGLLWRVARNEMDPVGQNRSHASERK